MANTNDILTQAMNDIDFDKILTEKLKEEATEAIAKSVHDSFAWGELRKTIDSKIQETLVPYIESVDFSQYVTKLDSVLTEIVNNTVINDNNKILEHFKTIMSTDIPAEVTASELFEKYIHYVESDIDPSGRDVEFDSGEPEYEPFTVCMDVTDIEKPSWSSYEKKTMAFYVEDEENQDLNIEFELWKWRDSDKNWTIHIDRTANLSSLKFISNFELYLMALSQNGTRIILDSEQEENDSVYSDTKPEATFN